MLNNQQPPQMGAALADSTLLRSSSSIQGRRVRWAAAMTGVAVLMTASACGSSESSGEPESKSAVKCAGEEVVVHQLVDMTGGSGQSPEVGDGLRAAMAAGNAACAGGRPVKLIQCDTKLNPNAALDCAREAISAKGVATLANFPVTGESARTVLSDEKIPDLFSSGVFPSEMKNPLSYPLGNRALLAVAGVDAAAGAGASSYGAVAPDAGAAVEQVLGFAKAEASKLGLAGKDPVIVPLDATDYTAYVAQAQATGAEAFIAGFTATGMKLFLNALVSSGVDMEKTKIVATGSSVPPQTVAEFGDKLDGLYLFGDVPSISDTENPAVARYLKDLKDSDIKTSPTGAGLAANIAGHGFFEVIKDLPAVDQASVAEAMKSFVLDQPGAPKIDFSQPAFPSDPVLSKFRLFNNQQAYYKVVDGKITPVSDGFVQLGSKPTFSSK